MRERADIEKEAFHWNNIVDKSWFGNIKETPNSFNNIETSSHVIETLGIHKTGGNKTQ